MKKETGITIVALVVTIVVMLILVGVSVTVSINGGLFNTTKESTYKTEVSQVKEALEEEIVQRKARRESVDNITIEDLDIPNKIKDKYKDKLIIIGKDIYYDPANIEKDNEEKLYFVVESKGSSLNLDIKDIESSKIRCAEQHFGSFNSKAIVTQKANFKEFIESI